MTFFVGRKGASLGLSTFAAVALVLHVLASKTGGVEGATGLFVFGDSYTDTGENVSPPYGMTWPGIPGQGGNRSCDGRNEVDYFAELFDVPSPTPWEHLDANNTNNGGVNFGVGGAGVTYAYGYRALDAQVDAFSELVNAGCWTKEHLRKSVALVSMGINDYTSFNRHGDPMAVSVLAANVVDGIALSLFRLQMLGIRHIMVASLVPGNCMPYSTIWVNDTNACVTNDTISIETILNNALLEDRVNLLNNGLHNADIIIVNMTKALEELFHNGEKYGFVDQWKQCCTGSCGDRNTSLWTVCADPTKKVIFDSIHPTQAGWKAVVDLYANVSGYTTLGPKLNKWKKKHHI